MKELWERKQELYAEGRAVLSEIGDDDDDELWRRVGAIGDERRRLAAIAELVNTRRGVNCRSALRVLADNFELARSWEEGGLYR